MTTLSTLSPHSCSSYSNNSITNYSENFSSFLNEVSKMTLLEEKLQHKEHQELHQPQRYQDGEPLSPLSINMSFNNSDFLISIETFASPRDEQARTVWTPPPIVAKTERRESSTPQASIVAPFDTVPSDRTITNPKKMNKKVLRSKRQRSCYNHNINLPPMFPGSPELDETADSNPFGRHVAIHSPIAGIGNRLNLGYIAKFMSHSPQLQRVFVPPPCPMKAKEHTIASTSSSTSSSSDESEHIGRMQTFFPVLDDPFDGDARNDGEGNRGEHDIGIATRALKMRRRRHKNDPCDIFYLPALTI